jgi:hypothetical protein
MAMLQKCKNADDTISYRVMFRLKGHPTATATFTRLTKAREWGTKTANDMKTGHYFGAAKLKTLDNLCDKSP